MRNLFTTAIRTARRLERHVPIDDLKEQESESQRLRTLRTEIAHYFGRLLDIHINTPTSVDVQHSYHCHDGHWVTRFVYDEMTFIVYHSNTNDLKGVIEWYIKNPKMGYNMIKDMRSLGIFLASSDWEEERKRRGATNV